MKLIILLTIIASFAGPAFAARGPAGKPNRNRLVRVVTVTQQGITKGDRLNGTITRLDQAAAFKPDLACLPELFARTGAEPVPGPTTDLLSAWARKNNCYVVAGIKTKVDGRIYNSAVVIDRAGKIVGRYDKIHPTEGELKGKTTPGQLDPPVFKTDFGTIGMQICFDVNWRDSWQRLKEKGAEIVVWPSAYPADRQLSALAWMNKFYVVSSTMDRFAAIYDITGEKLAKTGKFEGWAGAEISLDKVLFEIDYHVTKIRELRAKYGPRVKVAWLHAEDWVTLESRDPTLSVKDIIAEFELMPIVDYHPRAKRAVEEARQRK